ncbi:MAG: fibronectin type III domain-containing protein [Bacteroidia bacterium]|nr:fibronectin type III domain-containing protein [Bacteroidia bacterium]
MDGWYHAKAIYKNCTSNVGSVKVNVYRKPPAPLAFNNSPLCVDQEWIQLQASEVAGAYRYIWNGPNNFEAIGQVVKRPVALNNAGTYTVIAESEQGCRSEKGETQVIIHNNQFNLVPQVNEPVCEGKPLIIQVTPIPGAKYIWQGPQEEIETNTPRLFIAEAQLNQEGIYQLKAIVGNCTSQVVSIPVVVRPKPMRPTFVVQTPVCAGQNILFQSTNNTRMYYVWNGPNSFSPQGVANQFSKNNAVFADGGLYSVIAVANGCTSDPQILPVEVVELPNKPLATNSGPVCIGEKVTLFASGSFDNYVWQGPNGFSATGSVVERTIQSANQAGSYTVTSVVNGNCRSPQSITTVTIKPSPRTPTISTNSPICVGATLRLTASSISNSGSYLWQGPMGFVGTTREVAIPVTSLEQGGQYSLVFIQGGCTSEIAWASVVINPVPEIWSTGSNSPLCVGEQLKLSVVSNTPNATFSWRGPNGYVANDISNVFIRNNIKLEEAGSYSVTAISNGCTSGVAEVPVAVRPNPPIPTISGNTRLCEGDILNLIARGNPGSAFVWNGPNGFTSTGPIATRLIQSTVEGGNYQVRAIVNGCTSQTTGIQVLVNPAPVAPRISPESINRCIGDQYTFRVNNPISGVEYVWNGPNGFSATGSVIHRTVTTPEDAGVFTVTAIANGCSSQGNTTLLVDQPPFSFMATANTPLCVGQVLNLNVELFPNAKYLWSGPNGFSSTERNPSINNVQTSHSGAYYVAIIMGSCTSASRRVDVQVNPRPPAAIASANAITVCSGSTLNLNASTVVGATYYWSGPSGFTSREQNPSITNVQAIQGGTYAVQTIMNGCTSQASAINITVISKPNSPIISAPARLCTGQSLQFNASNVPDVIYRWVGPNGFTSSIQNPIRNNVTTADGGRYTLTLERRGCLSEPATVYIEIFPTPFVRNAGSNSPICAGETLTLTAPLFENASYHWIGPNGFTASSQNPIIQNAQTANSGVYSLMISTGACTSNWVTTNVTVQPSPNAIAVSTNSPICEGKNLEISATYNENTSYLWQGPNGFQNNQNSFVISNAQENRSGIYTLVASINNCTTIKEVEVIVSTMPPQPEIYANTPICADDDLVLKTPTIRGATYFWQGPSGFLSTVQNPVVNNVSFNHTGLYSLNLTIGNCTSSVATVNVEVLPSPGQLLVSANNEVCSGGTLLLNVNSIAGASYLWQGPNNFTSTLNNPIILNVQTYNEGVYTVTATLGICSSQAFIPVSVKQRPVIRGITSNSPVCVGTKLELFAPHLENTSYQWTGPNGFTSTEVSPQLDNVALQANGTYSLTLFANGCTSVIYTTPVTVKQQPTISIVGNTTICEGSTLSLSVLGTIEGVVQWRGPNNFISSASSFQRLAITTSEAGIYSVQVKESNCPVITASVSVEVVPRPTAPVARANSPICSGADLRLETAVTPGAQYVWMGPNNFYSTHRETSISSVTTANSGIYSLVVIQNGCSSLASSVGVTVVPSPGFIQAFNSSPVCRGETVNLTATTVGGARYYWSGPSGFSSESQNPVLVANANGVYSVIAVIGICSSNTATTSVRVLPSPGTIVASSNSPICAGNAINLNVTSVVGAQYEWTGPNGFISTTQNPAIINASINASGVYSVIARIGNCSSSTETVVQVQPTPTITRVGNNGPICSNNILSLFVEATVNATIRWSGPNGFHSTMPNPFIPNVKEEHSGVYSVIASIGNCYSSTQTTQVVVRPTPNNVVISGNTHVCENSSLRLQASPLSGAQYTWQGPSNLIVNSSSLVIDRVEFINSGEYSLITTLNGCSSVTKSTVVVKPNPILGSIGSNSPICSGNTLQLSAPFVPNAIYQWVGVNGFSSTLQNPVIPNIRLDHQGNYLLYVIVEGCTSQTRVTRVEVLPSPNAPYIPAEISRCWGTNLNVAVERSATLSYQWHGPNNFSAEGNNLFISNLTSLHAGIYTLQVSDGRCSSAPVTMNLRVNETKARWIQSSIQSCAGQLVQVPLLLEGTPPISVQYSINDGTTNNIVANGPTFDFAWTPSTNYQEIILLNVTDAQGCRANIRDTLKVFALSAPIVRLVARNYELCEGQRSGAKVAISQTNGKSWKLRYQSNGAIQEYNGQGDGIFELLPSQYYGAVNIELQNIEYTNEQNTCSQSLEGPNSRITLEYGANTNAALDKIIRTDCNSIDSVRFLVYGKGPWVLEYTAPNGLTSSMVVGNSNEEGPKYFTLPFEVAGNYFVSRIQDGRGCTQNLNLEFTIAPKRRLELNISILEYPICHSATGKIQANAKGEGIIRYAMESGIENTSGAFESLLPGTYRVKAFNQFCEVSQQVVIPQRGTPQIESIEPTSSSSLQVRWQSIQGAVGYILSYRQAGEANNWQELPVTQELSQNVHGLLPNTPYEFRLTAVCQFGLRTMPSPAVIGTTLEAARNCRTPEISAIRPTSPSSVQVVFGSIPAGGVCYIISYGLTGTPTETWQEVLVPVSAGSFTISGLVPGNQYEIRARTNCSICSSRSGERSNWSASQRIMLTNARHQNYVQDPEFKVYPNPTTGIINIECISPQEVSQELTLKIIDIAGKVYITQTLITSAAIQNVDISSLPAGVYSCIITYREKTILHRIIKQ